MIKELLTEAYVTTKRSTGINPATPAGFKRVLGDSKAWNMYTSALLEHLDPTTRSELEVLAKASRVALLENSMYQLNPYETLIMPILSVFYPKLIARELVTVTPIDKPEVIKAILLPKFTKAGSTTSYDAPSYDNISDGPALNVASGGDASVPGTHDLLAIAGYDSSTAHIQKDFYISEVVMTDNGTNNVTVPVDIRPTVDGTISASVTATINGTDYTDVLLGQINYYDGTLTLSSANQGGTGYITEAHYTFTVSLEENTINPKITLSVEKLRLETRDRQIEGEWSIQLEQDLKALFDIDIQSQLVAVMGQQIALDVDREIVNQLISTASSSLVPATHRKTFDKTVPAGYALGPKSWHANVLSSINPISAAIYTDTNIQAGDIIAVNPIDAAIFEDIDTFAYNGNSTDGGDLGYQTATVAGGKYKVLVSPVVPQGSGIITYKPAEEMKSVYMYAPYQMYLSPYPLQNKPSLTVTQRYATRLIRPKGLGLITFIET